MAFEPLQTDEKLEEPVKRAPDMDAAMLFGCSGFVGISIGGYILSVWPYFAVRETDRLTNLLLCAALGLIPAAIVGLIGTRRFGLAGACGFLGGSMATGIFLYLRIDQVFVSALARQAPKPDYPYLLTYLIPIAWIILSAILALVVMPSEPKDS